MAKSKDVAHKPRQEGTVVLEKLELPASVVADLHARVVRNSNLTKPRGLSIILPGTPLHNLSFNGPDT